MNAIAFLRAFVVDYGLDVLFGLLSLPVGALFGLALLWSLAL